MQSIVKREGEQKNATLINIKSHLSMVLEKLYLSNIYLIFILMSGLKSVDLILK